MNELRHFIDPSEEGWQIHRIALTRLRMSYGQFKQAKFQGEILLDGLPAFSNSRVLSGQTLCIRTPLPSAPLPLPYSLPLSLPYQDADFCIIDKPAPLSSTSSPRKNSLTLENALYAALDCPKNFLYRPVNRLDKGTSGLMLAAFSAHAQQRLQTLLHTPAFLREYLAVCEGHLPEKAGLIDRPISKADGATIRREIHPHGKPAQTHYRVLQETENRSLVLLRLETGRTHQIRVHLQSLGCPVTGDFLYGSELSALPGRFALHSHRITLLHPFTDAPLVVESPLPQELQTLLKSPVTGS